VASFLKHKGIKETAALLGGFDAWKAAGLKLEKGSGKRSQ
jgi:rhodanese-related sulfurtransferase